MMRPSDQASSEVEYHHLFTCGCVVISTQKLERCPQHSWIQTCTRTIWGLG